MGLWYNRISIMVAVSFLRGLRNLDIGILLFAGYCRADGFFVEEPQKP